LTIEEVAVAKPSVRGVDYIVGDPVEEIWYTGTLKTREGIGVGSPLTAVLRAYGGTHRRLRAIGNQGTFISVPLPCVAANILEDQGTIFFGITYNNLGVRFDFASLSRIAPVSGVTIMRVDCDHPWPTPESSQPISRRVREEVS
jgi:hypothetical protein